MKSSNADIKKRRREILELLEEKRKLSVPEISAITGVSEVTIRRDLIVLENMGTILRMHGSASFLDPDESQTRQNKIEQIKEAIAKKAAEFVQENDTLFINTSSTALASVKYLENKRVNAITNNVKIINLEPNPNLTVILSGGEVRFPKESLVGDIAIDFFSKMSSDVTIVGCSGLSKENTITTPIFHESKINSLMLERTNGLKILVADYTKIGISSNFISGNISDIDYLITDSYADQEILAEYEKSGVHIIQVNP